MGNSWEFNENSWDQWELSLPARIKTRNIETGELTTQTLQKSSHGSEFVSWDHWLGRKMWRFFVLGRTEYVSLQDGRSSSVNFQKLSSHEIWNLGQNATNIAAIIYMHQGEDECHDESACHMGVPANYSTLFNSWCSHSKWAILVAWTSVGSPTLRNHSF